MLYRDTIFVIVASSIHKHSLPRFRLHQVSTTDPQKLPRSEYLIRKTFSSILLEQTLRGYKDDPTSTRTTLLVEQHCHAEYRSLVFDCNCFPHHHLFTILEEILWFHYCPNVNSSSLTQSFSDHNKRKLHSKYFYDQ